MKINWNRMTLGSVFRRFFSTKTMPEKNSKLAIAFTGDPVDAEIVVNLLAECGIEATMNNQLMGTIAPWQVSAGGVGAVDVLVFVEDLMEAQPLVDEFMMRE